MTNRHFGLALTVVTSALIVTAAVAAQSPDRFSLTAANGIAFSEFRGYQEWPLIATSQPDKADGCGTSKVGCTKAILGNATMLEAYRDGIPANGGRVPDGAVMAKIEWLQDRDHSSPYGVTVPGAQTEMSFMLKDAKRFAGTGGWGYATFQYDAASDTFKPATTDPSFARACHGCHTGGAKATDFVFTAYAKR